MRFIKIFIAALALFSLQFATASAAEVVPAKATFSQGKSAPAPQKHHRRHRHRRVHRHKK